MHYLTVGVTSVAKVEASIARPVVIVSEAIVGARAQIAWIFLALAIITEVIGLTIMSMAVQRGNWVGYAVIYGAIVLSYLFLSKATVSIPMGIAYTVWEGSGVALITLVSAIVFEHSLTTREFVGLTLAIVGIILVNAGEVTAPSNPGEPAEDLHD